MAMDVPSGKPLSERLGGPSDGEGLTLASWMAGPPQNTTPVEVVHGELAARGPAAVQHYVDVPAEPG
jgi:hypothetical protein